MTQTCVMSALVSWVNQTQLKTSSKSAVTKCTQTWRSESAGRLHVYMQQSQSDSYKVLHTVLFREEAWSRKQVVLASLFS